MEEMLTLKEKEIMQLIVTGLSNTSIANKLIISTSTARTHINRIYKKLEVDVRDKDMNPRSHCIAKYMGA